MVITINKKSEDVQASVDTRCAFFSRFNNRGFLRRRVNDVMIDRNRLDSTPLKEGDGIEFLFYMGGGR